MSQRAKLCCAKLNYTKHPQQVKRCKYCVAEGETLLSKMHIYTPDMNWLRLWAVNGADDGLCEAREGAVSRKERGKG